MRQKDIIEQKEDYPRDDDGNVIFPDIKITAAEMNRWHATYIFHEWDDGYNEYREIADLTWETDLIEKKDELERNKILVYKLFKTPERPDNYHMAHHGWLRNLAYNFFKEVFKLPNSLGGMMNEFDLARIIIRKKTFDEIEKLISDNSLSEIHDLIFFIIAKIQDVYIREIEFFERPDIAKQMNNAGAEAEKLITVIERVRPDLGDERYNKPLPEIRNITFDFPDIDPIKIEDRWLNGYIVDAIKKDYNDRPYKNWRKEIKRFAQSYDEDIEKQKYRFHVAIALHNFFSFLKKFPVKQGKATSSSELLCIAKILEFGLIKIGAEGISDAVKIKNVRNYINPKRNKLFTYQSHVPIQPNLEILKKYFDDQFLACVPLVKHIETLGEAYFISERFDLQHLFKEIAHLIDCIKRRKEQIGWQFSIQGMPTENHPVIGNLFNLISPFRVDKEKVRLTELSFQLEGKEQTYSIKEDLPLMLIERALLEFYRNHREEFDVDIFTSKIHERFEDGAYRVESLGGYQKQSNRFLPLLCTNLYKFLLNEAPPERNVASATDKYSEIIAVILQRCLVFNHVRDEEYVVQNKVKQWLKEAKAQSKQETV